MNAPSDLIPAIFSAVRSLAPYDVAEVDKGDIDKAKRMAALEARHLRSKYIPKPEVEVDNVSP